MTNEMKLLTALCDALGFEVDTVLDYQEREYKLTKKGAEVIKCNKCGTRIGNGLPLDSCMCKSSANLVRVKV